MEHLYRALMPVAVRGCVETAVVPPTPRTASMRHLLQSTLPTCTGGAGAPVSSCGASSKESRVSTSDAPLTFTWRRATAVIWTRKVRWVAAYGGPKQRAGHTRGSTLRCISRNSFVGRRPSAQ